jgi:hypothetical protein
MQLFSICWKPINHEIVNRKLSCKIYMIIAPCWNVNKVDEAHLGRTEDSSTAT